MGRSPGGGHDNPLQYSCLEKTHGQRNLASYSPWGHKESDMTKQLSIQHTLLRRGKRSHFLSQASVASSAQWEDLSRFLLPPTVWKVKMMACYPRRTHAPLAQWTNQPGLRTTVRMVPCTSQSQIWLVTQQVPRRHSCPSLCSLPPNCCLQVPQ